MGICLLVWTNESPSRSRWFLFFKGIFLIIKFFLMGNQYSDNSSGLVFKRLMFIWVDLFYDFLFCCCWPISIWDILVYWWPSISGPSLAPDSLGLLCPQVFDWVHTLVTLISSTTQQGLPDEALVSYRSKVGLVECNFWWHWNFSDECGSFRQLFLYYGIMLLWLQQMLHQ